MNRDELQTAVLRALAKVAPEADPGAIDAQRPLRDQLDLDSMDLLRFAIAVHTELGVDIPEADYAKLDSLAACTAYLAARLA